MKTLLPTVRKYEYSTYVTYVAGKSEEKERLSCPDRAWQGCMLSWRIRSKLQSMQSRDQSTHRGRIRLQRGRSNTTKSSREVEMLSRRDRLHRRCWSAVVQSRDLQERGGPRTRSCARPAGFLAGILVHEAAQDRCKTVSQRSNPRRPGVAAVLGCSQSRHTFPGSDGKFARARPVQHSTQERR